MSSGQGLDPIKTTQQAAQKGGKRRAAVSVCGSSRGKSEREARGDDRGAACTGRSRGNTHLGADGRAGLWRRVLALTGPANDARTRRQLQQRKNKEKQNENQKEENKRRKKKEKEGRKLRRAL
jgi:hypothetical protein